jgi:hypothetical protein
MSAYYQALLGIQHRGYEAGYLSEFEWATQQRLMVEGMALGAATGPVLGGVVRVGGKLYSKIGNKLVPIAETAVNADGIPASQAVKGGTNAAEGVIASRINVRTGDANIKGSGLEYAWEKHGGTWGGNKSAFTISKDELKAVLQDPLVVKTPAYQSATSGNYIRTVDMGRTIGIDAKAGGQPTNFLTIITDSKGNLVNTFPGKTF